MASNSLDRAIRNYQQAKNMATYTDALYSMAIDYGVSHVTLLKIRDGQSPRKSRVIKAVAKLIEEWGTIN